MSARHLVFLVLDSCRFDSYAAARTPNMDRIAQGERRYSYASWTSPSHYTYLMGLVPHTNPQGVFASEVYKGEFQKWVDRLGIDGLSFKSFVPELSLPKVLQVHGYRTAARVSLPVLNPASHLNRHFDDYKLMPDHNDFAGIVKQIEFDEDEPQFWFCNLGETHYPYMLPPGSLPHISGVHGVFKRMDDELGQATEDRFFDESQMRDLHQQQIKTVEYVDGVLDALIAKAPVDTHFIITADHGECFGEGGFFGHGPIVHEKVMEVPFLEGRKR
ncbi:sulfatase-like protein [Panacagrimonas perspica]|uniref:Sulfatase-like protein n=1 Tax=Panacagrimonas perspica TaxID=381431 RepID=A0A4S3K845_9GAMM|nr:sulfatase-like hydrolase/transferase [Panacagrimonas perspica]TDU32058.1 sulfatase-like protein [Panacagrimonas perspica]THD04413.1 metalloenzyme [Panacagrimonas perspica]